MAFCAYAALVLGHFYASVGRMFLSFVRSLTYLDRKTPSHFGAIAEFLITGSFNLSIYF